jgi:hypothetical protein
VLLAYSKTDPHYGEFFPLNYFEYTHPKRSEISGYVDHFIAHLTLYPTLAPNVLLSFQSLKAAFDPARETQLERIETVSTLIEETSEERKSLNDQLYISVLTLALQYPNKPEFANVFFDEALLFYHPHTIESEAGIVHTLKIKGLRYKNSGLSGINDKILTLSNLSKNKFRLFMVSALAKITVPEKYYDLNPETTITNFEVQTIINKPTDKYLIISNIDATTASASVEITGRIKG